MTFPLPTPGAKWEAVLSGPFQTQTWLNQYDDPALSSRLVKEADPLKCDLCYVPNQPYSSGVCCSLCGVDSGAPDPRGRPTCAP